jgi:hypothetical protein
MAISFYDKLQNIRHDTRFGETSGVAIGGIDFIEGNGAEADSRGMHVVRLGGKTPNARGDSRAQAPVGYLQGA